jgi:hypothetical protein
MSMPSNAPSLDLARENALRLQALNRASWPLLLVAIGLFLNFATSLAAFVVPIVMAAQQVQDVHGLPKPSDPTFAMVVAISLLVAQFVAALVVVGGRFLCWDQWRREGRFAAGASALFSLVALGCVCVVVSLALSASPGAAVDGLVLPAVAGLAFVALLLSEGTFLKYLYDVASAARAEQTQAVVATLAIACLIGVGFVVVLVVVAFSSPSGHGDVYPERAGAAIGFLMQLGTMLLALVYAGLVLRVRLDALYAVEAEMPTSGHQSAAPVVSSAGWGEAEELDDIPVAKPVGPPPARQPIKWEAGMDETDALAMEVLMDQPEDGPSGTSTGHNSGPPQKDAR